MREQRNTFDLSAFSCSMLVAILGCVVGGSGFQSADSLFDKGWNYSAWGVAGGSFFFILWMSVVFGHQIIRAFSART